MTWRDEVRQDKLTSAQIARERDAARAQAGLAAARAAAAERREDQAARDARRDDGRRQRAKQRAELAAWLAGHVTDLLFIPVIAVPGLLAWTAMASYGHALYGWPGYLLPAFSEGGAWVFAAARTLRLRSDPEAPTWHLLTGVWAFAGAGAALNFAHGLTSAAAKHPHLQPGTGAVMALVSAAGITAHQMITAGPRRSRAERQQRRLDRRAGARVLAVRRAAIRHAAAVLDADGAARLVIAPGLVAVDRRGRLARVSLPGLPDPTSELARLAGDAAAEIGALAASLRESLPFPAPELPPPAPPAIPEPPAAAVPEPPAGLEGEPSGDDLPAALVAALLRELRASVAGQHESPDPGMAHGEPAVARPDPEPSAAAGSGTDGEPEGEPDGPDSEAGSEPDSEPDDPEPEGDGHPRPLRPRPARAARPARPRAARSGPPRRAAALDMSPEAQDARKAYRASVKAGRPLSDRALAEQFDRSRRWAANQIASCKGGPRLAGDVQTADAR